MANRAWVYRGGSQWTMEDAPTPEPRAGEALIKIGGVGFCGSERRFEKEAGELLGPDETATLPWVGGKGHEVAGVVEETGVGVVNCKPGDRVAILHNMGCKRCRYCTSGFENNCPTPRERVHLAGYQGYMAVPSALAFQIPDDMSIEEAAMVEPCAIGVHAAERRAKVGPGETVVVLGVGQIGAFASQMARISGGRIIAVDPRGLARRSAADLGFDVIVDSSTENVVEAVMDETGGRGADVVMECAGIPGNYNNQMLEMLAPASRIVQVGHWGTGSPITLDLLKLFNTESSLITSRTCLGADYDRTLDLVQMGRMKLNWMGGTAIRSYPMEDFIDGRKEWLDEQHMLYVMTP